MSKEVDNVLRAQMDVYILYDTSGSMDTEVSKGTTRFEMMKTTLKRIGKLLSKEERIGLVHPVELDKKKAIFHPASPADKFGAFVDEIEIQGCTWIPTCFVDFVKTMIDSKKKSYFTFLLSDMDDILEDSDQKYLEKVMYLKGKPEGFGSTRFPNVSIMKIGDNHTNFDKWCNWHFYYHSMSDGDAEETLDHIVPFVTTQMSRATNDMKIDMVKKIDQNMSSSNRLLTQEEREINHAMEKVKQGKTTYKDIQELLEEMEETAPEDATEAKTVIQKAHDMKKKIDLEMKKLDQVKIDFKSREIIIPEGFDAVVERSIEMLEKDFTELKKAKKEALKAKGASGKLLTRIGKYFGNVLKSAEAKFKKQLSQLEGYRGKVGKMVGRMVLLAKKKKKLPKEQQRVLEQLKKLKKRIKEYMTELDDIFELDESGH